MTRRLRKVGVALAVLLWLPGCTARMVTTPTIETPPTAEVRVEGKVVYDGNREYLPRTIAEVTGETAPLMLRYAYEVKHGRDSVPQLLPLFNPLTIVGFPVGEDTV